MGLIYFFIFFVTCVFGISRAFPISGKQANFTITMQKGYSGVFGNKTIVGQVGVCYPLQQHMIPSIIHLNQSSEVLHTYTFHGFFSNNCAEDSIVTKPFKPNVPISLNERKSICSMMLGNPTLPTFPVSVIFTHENDGSTYVIPEDKICYDICSDSDESFHYPNSMGIYEKDGIVANNFVRLYSNSSCLIDNALLHPDGSENIRMEDDLFELSLKDPKSVVKAFVVTIN